LALAFCKNYLFKLFVLVNKLYTYVHPFYETSEFIYGCKTKLRSGMLLCIIGTL